MVYKDIAHLFLKHVNVFMISSTMQCICSYERTSKQHGLPNGTCHIWMFAWLTLSWSNRLGSSNPVVYKFSTQHQRLIYSMESSFERSAWSGIVVQRTNKFIYYLLLNKWCQYKLKVETRISAHTPFHACHQTSLTFAFDVRLHINSGVYSCDQNHEEKSKHAQFDFL